VALLRRNAAAVDLFLAPTEGYAEEMAALLDVPRDRIETTPPGVDLAPFESIQVEPDGRFRIGFLSRLSPVKGLDILVEAFRMMEARRLGGQVLAVAGQADGGGARYWRRLRDSLDRDGLAGCVEEGGQPNLAGKVRFLKRCSVFCLPARQAGRAAAACLEALAAGLPVVAPNAGIYPDILTPTGAGVLLQRGDAADVAEVIEALRDDPVRRECMAEAARAASRLFSAEAMVRRTIEAYERVVARLSEGRS
jgi:glycosyltransferase involved in cell wall biosynthesis